MGVCMSQSRTPNRHHSSAQYSPIVKKTIPGNAVAPAPSDPPRTKTEFKRRQTLEFNDFKTKSRPVDAEATVRYQEILALDFESLRDALQNETYKASTVMCAYVWRAMAINDEINCITQVITDAFTDAERLDKEYYKKGTQKGPLHGLPFSVKSNFEVAGYPVTVGLEKRLTDIKPSTCSFVQYLINQGAVPFCLTNVPQGLLSYITSNPLYGTTRNPWDLDRTPGGSSGGDAALVSAGGAAFGTGNDLAGSLRIPAAFCGLVTLKPTKDRLVTTGVYDGLPEQGERGRLGMSVGFYTRNVKDQEYLLGLIIGNPDYRRLCSTSSEEHLQELPQKERFTIGYFYDDCFQSVVPSSKRAVLETIAKLESKGHDCKEFSMKDIEMIVDVNGKNTVFTPNDFADMLFRNILPDNGAYMANNIYNGEPYDEHMGLFIRLISWKNTYLCGSIVNGVTGLFAPLLSKSLGVLGNAHNSGESDSLKNQENTDVFKECWIKYWDSLGIDALICPSFITPAQQFNYPQFLSTGTFLTGLFNMLDVPAGIVPVGHVNSDDIENLKSSVHFPINGDVLLRWQKQTCMDTIGLPTAVQVVTRPREEEMCLRVMQMVEESMKENVESLKWNQNHQPAPRGTVETGRQKSARLFERVNNQ